MKKIMLAVAFVCVALATVSADKWVGARGTIGLGVGSQAGGYLDLGKSISFGGALYANIPLDKVKNFGVQPELNVFKNKIGRQFSGEGGSSSWAIEYTSCDIPVLLTYSIPTEKFTLMPEAGPYVSIPFGKAKYTGDGDGSADIKTSLIFGFACGAAAAFPLSNGGKFVVDVRYLNDVTALGVKDAGGISTRGTLNASVAYQMKLN